MKAFFLIISIVAGATLISRAQPNSGFKEILNGYTLPDSQRIAVKQLQFQTDVYRVADMRDDHLTMILRTKKSNDRYKNSGYLTSVDIRTARVEWEKSIHNFDIYFTDDYIVYTNDDGNKVFERKTGKFLYTDDGSYEYIDKKRNFALKEGARYIDLANKESKWYRNIPSETGYWEDIKWVSDSVFYVASNGVHFVNLQDGRGWSFKMNSGKQSRSGFGGIGGGIVAGAVGGTYIYFGGATYYGIASNIVFDSSTHDIIYMSGTRLVKIDSLGNRVWQHSILRREIGITELIDRGDRFISINTGLAVSDGIRQSFNSPSLTAYSKHSGTELYHKDLKGTNGVHMSYLLNDTLLLNVGKHLYKYEVMSGNLLASREGGSLYGLEKVVPSEIYLSESGNIYSLNERYPNSFFVQDTAMRVVLLDKMLNSSLTWDDKEIRKSRGTFNDILILQGTDDIAITKNGSIMAIMSLTGKVVVDKEKMFVFEDNLLSIVDLSVF